MKANSIKSFLSLAAGCLALALSGCISLPNSPMSATPKFYMLSAVHETQAGKKIKMTPGIIIGVGPVKIPEYLDRPQIVTKDKEGILKFDEFNRWGESLDLGLARLVREDLTDILPGARLTLYPWNPSIAVKYQVNVEVVQLDSELDKDMYLVVQWVVIDMKNSKTLIIKRSDFRMAITPQNYNGLAKALSASLASLSSQIAQAMAALKP